MQGPSSTRGLVEMCICLPSRPAMSLMVTSCVCQWNIDSVGTLQTNRSLSARYAIYMKKLRDGVGMAKKLNSCLSLYAIYCNDPSGSVVYMKRILPRWKPHKIGPLPLEKMLVTWPFHIITQTGNNIQHQDNVDLHSAEGKSLVANPGPQKTCIGTSRYVAFNRICT